VDRTPPRVDVVFSAVVLAAGRSSRMGRDKALIELGGQPLWQRQLGLLRSAGAAEVFLSARDDQSWAHAATAHFDAVVRDVETDCGPLAGIVAAFDRATQPWLFVLAIDLPAMTADYIQRLVAQVHAGRGVVPACGKGPSEPLCALYPRAAKPVAARRLERRQLKMYEFVGALERARLVTRVDIEKNDGELFANWNEPADAPSDL
jgi:molybdopterin-guanine dinucleotide biosynthesis protein A